MSGKLPRSPSPLDFKLVGRSTIPTFLEAAERLLNDSRSSVALLCVRCSVRCTPVSGILTFNRTVPKRAEFSTSCPTMSIPVLKAYNLFVGQSVCEPEYYSSFRYHRVYAKRKTFMLQKFVHCSRRLPVDAECSRLNLKADLAPSCSIDVYTRRTRYSKEQDNCPMEYISHLLHLLDFRPPHVTSL